ncbi:carboxypeptidase B [Strongylocentrotus purpuratus]|uniref:Peptidase M14 domain-containing protein n=1 Tax=Strongylocentrotus purpuratus TaxID=7668 RepID=A0A7M7RD84_STRPU|nr:carboxypeptidase B [Strongylocentrotus purpuratus]
MKLFILVALVAAASAVRYDGYQALRVEPRDDLQLDFLNSLQKELEGKISFWSQPLTTKRPTDIVVQPRFQDDLKEILDAKQIKYSVMIDDVQTLIDSQSRSDDDVKISADFDYSVYHTYEEIQAWVFEITAAHSAIAQQFQIATSSEGRPINAVKIMTGGVGTKKAVYWQGGIHAREWVSPATVMFITKSLLENYGVDSDVTEILDKFDYYIVPSLNVDGYSYTWTMDRLWRKTRSINSGSVCRGVDPNRNYEYEWGGEGASTSACSDTYRGPTAFSEPEIAGSSSFLLNANQEFVCYIDFHSYSQLWLAPWSYTARARLPNDMDDHDEAAAKAVNALQSVYGTEYIYGPSARTLYAASGCSEDWGYATLGAKYSYVVELRDTGRYGFLLPANQIIPTGQETYEAVKALCKHMADEY